ncbi:hypothetical protein HBH56_113510 [Parastagonospora nodorum]|nr:hypothetical protein HBH56_113510 [Parastagonospora nodorum]KAH3951214.1 hypothetical protein HBH53_069190 [Parastagonospora nodorum]KAH3999829.1 hypothetical protein HBI10_116370 [Parastagonospora nodorum]KAH4013309.1 hypothetical protein HBI13_182430 [Parastagonospora nodorum]KAH4035383.1 hypothetical protein HBI09_098950 [Parastagonospora nodorum]
MFPNFILATDPLVATTFGGIELLRPVCKWSLTSTLIAHPSLDQTVTRPAVASSEGVSGERQSVRKSNALMPKNRSAVVNSGTLATSPG